MSLHLNRETNRWRKACPEPPRCAHPLHDRGIHCECARLNWAGRCWHKAETDRVAVLHTFAPAVPAPRCSR